MIKNIVFDVGKVLVDFDWQGFMDTLDFPPKVYEKVASATVLSELWNEFDRSRMSDEEILLDITEDGVITEDEKPDMQKVLGNLEELEAVTQNLRIWVKKNLSEMGR